MGLTPILHSVLNAKALVDTFNQEKALVGAFSVIMKIDCETDGSYAALMTMSLFAAEKRYVLVGAVSHGVGCGSEIPASYSNVAGAMCWIDYVMSTVLTSAI